MVSLSTPVLLIENDCVLTASKSVLDAFDRLEVVEYSAQSLIEAAAIGNLVPIGDDEIRDLEINFC
jgi:L-fuculose-phosphate aldolase